jgi:hypothetical protein
VQGCISKKYTDVRTERFEVLVERGDAFREFGTGGGESGDVIVGWLELANVTDKTSLPVDPGFAEAGTEELARDADKGQSVICLVVARRFTDEGDAVGRVLERLLVGDRPLLGNEGDHVA